MVNVMVQVGRPAPPFSAIAVVDGRLKGMTSTISMTIVADRAAEVSLASYTEANHWLILIFFPKAWSFICPTEIKAFSARLEEFLYSRSCAVVFASTDSEHSLKAWNSTSDMEGGLNGVHVPLISDCNHKMSKDYGVLIEEEGTAQRALFIIDPKGMVRSISVNDADVGRSVDEALRILDALAFKDEFGEGCPVDWKKGEKGIELTARNRVEGSVDVSKKSWSEWARPKLSRAWSSASGRDLSTYSKFTIGHVRGNSEFHPISHTASATHSQSPSQLSSGQQSPMVSPTSGYMNSGSSMQMQMDKLLAQQRMDNMQATLQNRDQSQTIGLAS